MRGMLILLGVGGVMALAGVPAPEPGLDPGAVGSGVVRAGLFAGWDLKGRGAWADGGPRSRGP